MILDSGLLFLGHPVYDYENSWLRIYFSLDSHSNSIVTCDLCEYNSKMRVKGEMLDRIYNVPF